RFLLLGRLALLATSNSNDNRQQAQHGAATHTSIVAWLLGYGKQCPY
ncbi:MAG: hypothetical protein ACI85K_002841, partial [Hyphomicrobiaceae bacterium]